MDAKTSLVMANAAGLRAGDRVLDPFAGSGGLLLAAAEMGAGVTVGVDVNATIDFRRVAANFQEQGLAPPVRYLSGDAASAAVQAELGELGPFDIICADPPYGLREKGAGGAEGAAHEAVQTLMELASSALLRVGGRVVFFVPAHPSCPDIRPWLPTHPCLAMRDAERQPLNANLDRWLVALDKTREARPGEGMQPPPEGEEDGGAPEGDGGGLRPWHYRPPSRDGGG
jgi:tRNA (guanine10-N2)-methyltransferase